MTAGETRLIQQLSDFVRDWRKEDAEWKESADRRLRGVESYITADKARNEAAAESTQQNRLNRAQILTAAGIVGSFVLGLINHFVQ